MDAAFDSLQRDVRLHCATQRNRAKLVQCIAAAAAVGGGHPHKGDMLFAVVDAALE